MSESDTCDYCGTEELVYEMSPMRGGTVHRCLECLAIEQGQQKLNLPLDSYDDLNDDLLQSGYKGARSWFKVLARIKNDDPIVKRDEDAIGTLPEDRREMLLNLMGSAAYYPPSEIIDADGDPEQTTLSEGVE